MRGIKRKKQREESNQVSVREFETETESETVRHERESRREKGVKEGKNINEM